MPFAHAVLMRQTAFKDVADDLHIAVGMRAEAFARCDAVVVNHSQCMESHVRRIVIIREGKRMPGIQPATVGVAAIFRAPDQDHVCFSL
jgi:hypothetical protein